MAAMDNPYIRYLVAAVVIVAILYFVPFLRRLVSVVIRLAIFALAIAVAVGGVTMLLNNETIFEQPGAKLRVKRFISENSARTTESGTGLALCDPAAPPITKAAEDALIKQAQAQFAAEQAAAAAAAASPVAASSPGAQTSTATAPSPASTPSPVAASSAAAAAEMPEDDYPELMRRSYPGIPHAKLFDLSKEVVNSLGGWKIVKEDARAGTLDCTYTSRVVGMEDDVKITVMPNGEIDVCSRSGTARPDSTSLWRYFPGDFGANVGHIKQFYETIEPKMDAVYQEEQEKENAKKPH